MGNRRGQCSEAHDPGDVRELRSGFIERLFCEATVRHVLSCADVLHCAALVFRPVCDQMKAFYGSIAHQYAMLVFEVAGRTLRSLTRLVQHAERYRMDWDHDP